MGIQHDDQIGDGRPQRKQDDQGQQQGRETHHDVGQAHDQVAQKASAIAGKQP
jgi:hypothetical protein